ncbi:hypothetical protein LR61_04360 [Morganella morganii]|nr:hypothetical protein LR61_04360 [Morganella morganii]
MADTPTPETKLPICGIIMPIANTEGYPEGHWTDVYDIICQAASDANFTPNLVSFDDDIGVIQKRIVQNIYDNPIVVCDISSRNANVMFELGMRLAFDKPTIIIKDNKTPYSFDISPVEHLEYPSDLRYQSITTFQNKLKNKIVETHIKANNDPNYTTFLKHFGTFKVAQLEEKEVSSTELLVSELNDIKKLIKTTAMTSLDRNTRPLNKAENTELDDIPLLNGTLVTFHIPEYIKNTNPNLRINMRSLTSEITGMGFDFKYIELNDAKTSINIHFNRPISHKNYNDIQTAIESSIALPF